MTTPSILSEQIRRIHARSLHNDDLTSLKHGEVRPLIFQAVNMTIKAQTKEQFTSGLISIPKSSIASYDVTVISEGTRSYVTLPVVPIHAPMQMGVWEIHPREDPFSPFIPIIDHDAAVMGESYVSALEQQVGYYVDGMKVRFTKNIKNEPYQLSLVTAKLLVQHSDSITDNDILPITADQELEIIRIVLETISMSRGSEHEINKREEMIKQVRDE
jgi:hypothetical protein